MELLIGSVFVLGQAAITQAVSLVKRMHEVAGEPAWIPSDKESIMALESPIHAGTGLQKILIINAVANYFKHRHEWWDDWTGPKHSLKTIQIVSKLGLGPKGYHNLEHALRELEVYLPDMAPLAQLVVTWREQLRLISEMSWARAGYEIRIKVLAARRAVLLLSPSRMTTAKGPQNGSNL